MRRQLETAREDLRRRAGYLSPRWPTSRPAWVRRSAAEPHNRPRRTRSSPPHRCPRGIRADEGMLRPCCCRRSRRRDRCTNRAKCGAGSVPPWPPCRRASGASSGSTYFGEVTMKQSWHRDRGRRIARVPVAARPRDAAPAPRSRPPPCAQRQGRGPAGREPGMARATLHRIDDGPARNSGRRGQPVRGRGRSPEHLARDGAGPPACASSASGRRSLPRNRPASAPGDVTGHEDDAPDQRRELAAMARGRRPGRPRAAFAGHRRCESLCAAATRWSASAPSCAWWTPAPTSFSQSRLVVHQQDAARATCAGRRPMDRGPARPCRPLATRARTTRPRWCRLHADAAAVLLYNRVGQPRSQPVPCPTSFVAKTVEDPRHHVARHARAVVAELQEHHVAVAVLPAANHRRPVSVRRHHRLLGVDHKVEQHLLDLVRVGEDRGQPPPRAARRWRRCSRAAVRTRAAPASRAIWLTSTRVRVVLRSRGGEQAADERARGAFGLAENRSRTPAAAPVTGLPVRRSGVRNRRQRLLPVRHPGDRLAERGQLSRLEQLLVEVAELLVVQALALG